MKVLLKELEIKNFMCFDYKKFDFNEEYNLFSGFNGVGKTTVLNALTWCLTGKDYYDNEKFKMFPIRDGVEQFNLKIEVTTKFLNTDTMEITTISRNKSPSGTTTIELNDNKVKVSDLDKQLKTTLGFGVEDFKLLCLTKFATELHWKDLKNLIFSKIEDVDIKEIISADEFKPIKERVIIEGYEEVKQDVENKAKKIATKDKELLKYKIEEKAKEISVLETEVGMLEDYQKNKKILEEKLENHNELFNIQVEKNKELVNKQSELNDLISQSNSMKQELSIIEIKGKEINSQIEIISNVSQLKENAKERLSQRTPYIKKIYEDKMKVAKEFANRLQSLKVRKEEEKIKYENMVNNDDLNCPLCDNVLSGEKLKKAKEKDITQLQKVMLDVDNEINKIITNGTTIKVELKAIENEIVENEKELSVIDTKDGKEFLTEDNINTISNLNKKKAELLDKHTEIKNLVIMKDKEIKLKREEIESVPKPQFIEAPMEIQKKLEEINGKLYVCGKFNECKEEYQKLLSEFNECDKLLRTYEIVKTLLTKFNKIRTEKMNSKLKQYFNYVDFLTIELTKDGNEIETFKICHDGRTLKELSDGEIKRCALDLTVGLQKIMGVKLPIILDQLGELSKMPIIDTQLIVCKTVEELEENEEYMNKYKILNFKSER